ncbi:hypothetical protein ONZ45_g19507 [Pleurotus djamor]|nr:hypothetical protein ONZ45_g19507 [Pleurotus djamor]
MDPYSFVRVHFPPILERNLYLPAKYASRLLLLLLGLTLWSAIILVNASDAYAQIATSNSFLILFLGNNYWSARLDDTILLWMDIAGFIKEFAEVLIDTPELPPSVQEPILFHLRDLVNSLGLTCGDRSKLSNNPITRQANANPSLIMMGATMLGDSRDGGSFACMIATYFSDPLAFVPDMLDHTSKRFAWNVDIHNLPNTAI